VAYYGMYRKVKVQILNAQRVLPVKTFYNVTARCHFFRCREVPFDTGF